MFIGLREKWNIWLHFILALGFLAWGLYLFFSRYSYGSSCHNAIWIILSLSVTMVFYVGCNIGLLNMKRMDPRFRRGFSKMIVIARWFSFVSNVAHFSIIINMAHPWTSQCVKDDPGLGVYLQVFWILILIEIIVVSIALLFSCCIFGSLIFLALSGRLELDTGGQTDDPGTPYFNRTQVDSFKNILQKMGMVAGNEDEDMKCGICLEEYTEEDILRKMPCDHFYHKDCIDEWLNNRSECPICKQNIRDAESKFASEV